MRPENKLLVQQSFEKILPIAPVAADLFYGRLFELDPSVRPLFKGDMEEQGRKLMVMLNLAIKSLDTLDELVGVVGKLGINHARYGVKPYHYELVGIALIWTLEQGLGTDFTPETRQAWIEVYSLLSEVMKAATYEVYEAPTQSGVAVVQRSA